MYNHWLQFRTMKWHPLLQKKSPKVQDMIVDVLENQLDYNDNHLKLDVFPDQTKHDQIREVLIGAMWLLIDELSSNKQVFTKEDTAHFARPNYMLFSLDVSQYINDDTKIRVQLCRDLVKILAKKITTSIGSTQKNYFIYNLALSGKVICLQFREKK